MRIIADFKRFPDGIWAFRGARGGTQPDVARPGGRGERVAGAVVSIIHPSMSRMHTDFACYVARSNPVRT